MSVFMAITLCVNQKVNQVDIFLSKLFKESKLTNHLINEGIKKTLFFLEGFSF